MSLKPRKVRDPLDIMQCSRCNLKEIEKSRVFVAVLTAFIEIWKNVLEKAVLGKIEFLEYSNGKHLDTFYLYTLEARVYRNEVKYE